uniref:Golgi to ER traffic protein 4 homolog n=1 Tax=Panthera onca TaxID=9690 RepID=UPI002952E87F|nr:Golgi to ER traffic protein 4 homolog [Panthera onca]
MAAAAAMAEQESARNGARNRGGVQRVEGKLRASVEKGDYYEAHQMYRTLFFRYMSQSKHTEARELMCSGALLFFSHGQQNSAADLSMLVLESLEKAEVEVAADLLENLAKLFSLMDPNSPERVAFVSRALKWSSGGSGKLGHPRLHQLLALTLWKGRPRAGKALGGRVQAVPRQPPLFMPWWLLLVLAVVSSRTPGPRGARRGGFALRWSGPSCPRPATPSFLSGTSSPDGPCDGTACCVVFKLKSPLLIKHLADEGAGGMPGSFWVWLAPSALSLVLRGRERPWVW